MTTPNMAPPSIPSQPDQAPAPAAKQFPEVPIVPRAWPEVLRYGDPAARARQREQAWVAACHAAGGKVPYPMDMEAAMAYLNRLMQTGGDFHGVVAFLPQRILETAFTFVDWVLETQAQNQAQATGKTVEQVFADLAAAQAAAHAAAAQPAHVEGGVEVEEGGSQECAASTDPQPSEGEGTDELQPVNSVSAEQA